MPLATIGPPPRKIVPRPNYKKSTWVEWFIIMPHTLVGVGLLLVFLAKLAMGTIGTKVDAEMVSKYFNRSSKGGMTYYVKYQFPVDGEMIEGRSRISHQLYQAMPEQERVPVAYLNFAPGVFSDFIEPGKTFPDNTWMLLFFSAFWNAMLFVLLHYLVFRPQRSKHLVIHGAETEGVVTDIKLTNRRQSPSAAEISYQYEVNGQPHTGKESVPMDVHDATQVGDELKVVFDPANPKRSVAVTLCPWEVVADARVVASGNQR